VTTGCATIHHRHRPRPIRTTSYAISVDHPTCTDGIAESCAATPDPNPPYTDCPKVTASSVNPTPGSIRGGATGTSIWMSRQAPVSSTIVSRTWG
jgi:hypothetical protein